MTPHRADSIDVLRGMAMLWMTVFHFCFDLSHFGLWPQDFRADPWWTQQRTAIVSLFLLCAGCGQAMALDAGWGWARFARRWGYIVAAAALVTLGSWWMFPQSFIYFGVLHGMAVMLVLVRLLAGAGQHLWWLGAVMLALPWVAQALLQGPWAAAAPWFDGRALNWLGLVARKPWTEDYVPVFPWLGVMCWGMALGQLLLHHHWAGLRWVAPPALHWLAWLGRHSLGYYLLHQPLMIGALMLWLALRH